MLGGQSSEKLTARNKLLVKDLELPDGRRVDATSAELLRRLNGENISQEEKFREMTELRYGVSQTLAALESGARQKPQARIKLGLSAKEIRTLLEKDMAVDSSDVDIIEKDKGNERSENKKGTKAASIRAVASYLVDGMSVFKEGEKVRIVLEGSKSASEKHSDKQENVVIVDLNTFKSYVQILNNERKAGDKSPRLSDTDSSIEFSLTKNTNANLLNQFLKDRFGISKDEKIQVLKSGRNSSEGLFYWHDGSLKFDSKIVEKPESQITRKARSIFMLNEFVRRRSQKRLGLAINNVTMSSVKDVEKTNIIEKTLEILQGRRTTIEAVKKPIAETLEENKELIGITQEQRAKLWGDDLYASAEKGTDIRMVSDAVLLRVLCHVYSEDFNEVTAHDVTALKDATFRNVVVFETIAKILATQELTRLVFEYTLGSPDITEHKKQVSTAPAEERKRVLGEMVEEYRILYGEGQSVTSEGEQILYNNATSRATALRNLISSCWEIAQVNNLMNKESGDWNEEGKEIAGFIRQDAYQQDKLLGNIKIVYHSLDSLKLPGLSGKEVMERYYWNLGYRVVRQENNPKTPYKLEPRQGTFIDRQGIRRSYEVSSNRYLITQCTGFYKDFEVEKAGLLQMARARAGQELGRVDKPKNDFSEEEDVNGFIPQELDRERIDRETPILAITSHLFSASSVLTYVSMNAGLGICTFDGLGRFRDTGEDPFAHDKYDPTKRGLLTRENILRGNRLTSSPNSALSWKRFLELFQPEYGVRYGAQQFLDSKTSGSLATSQNLTGWEMVPVDDLDKEGKVRGVDIFIPAELKYYGYNENNQFCIQTLNRDYATRFNTIIKALQAGTLKIFGPLERGFEGFDRLMDYDNPEIANNGYLMSPSNMVHKAKLAEWMDAFISSAKDPSAISATSVIDGKAKDRFQEFYNTITDVAAIDKIYKALNKNATAVGLLISLLPTFGEDNIIKEVATALSTKRASVKEKLEGVALVTEALRRGALQKADAFIGPIYTSILHFSSRFPSLIGDGISIGEVTVMGENGPERKIDLGIGYRVGMNQMYKPGEPATDLNRNLPLVGLMQYLNWFNSRFQRTTKFISPFGVDPYEGKDAGEIKERQISIRKSLNELILTFSLFRNTDRANYKATDPSKSETSVSKIDPDPNVVDFGHHNSRFVRDYLGYTATAYLHHNEPISYTDFLEEKLKELEAAFYPTLTENQKKEYMAATRERVVGGKVVMKGLFSQVKDGIKFKGRLNEEITENFEATGKITGIETIDRLYERAMYNCLLSFEAIGIAERLGILVDDNFTTKVIRGVILENTTYLKEHELEERIQELLEDKGIEQVKSGEEDKLAASIRGGTERMATIFGGILELNSRVTSEVAKIQTESVPATRDILGHIAARVERLSTGDVWGRFLFETARVLDERTESDTNGDYSTSPLVLALGRLAETDHSVADAYGAIRQNLGLILLGNDLPDGYGMELAEKNKNVAGLYRGNIFTPSSVRLSFLTDPRAIPLTTKEGNSPAFRKKIADALMGNPEFVKAYEKNEKGRDEAIEYYVDFYITIGRNPFDLMLMTQRAKMGPVEEVLESRLATLANLAPLFPGPMAILTGSLVDPKQSVATGQQYTAINANLDVVENIAGRILVETGHSTDYDYEKHGTGSKIGRLKHAIDRLMIGASKYDRELGVLARNDSVYRNFTGHQDPVYVLQEKKRLIAAHTESEEKLSKINVFGWVPLPQFAKAPLEFLGLAIKDFGTNNVIAHASVGATVGAVALGSVVFGNLSAIFGPVGFILGGLGSAILLSPVTRSIGRSLANRDMVSTSRTLRGEFKPLRGIVGRPNRSKDDKWSNIDIRKENQLKAETMRKRYDWKKGLPLPISKSGNFVYKLGEIMFPQIPVLGPIIRAIEPKTFLGIGAKIAVTTLGMTAFGFATGGPVLAVATGIWGAVESIKTFKNLDTSLPLVASDLAIADEPHRSIQGKAVNNLYSKLLEIPVKE